MLVLRGMQMDCVIFQPSGRILTLFLILGPKFVPMVIAAGFIQGTEATEAFGGPELSGTFETTLLLSAG